MSQLIFITGNQHKIRAAQHILHAFGATLESRKLDIPEIQSEDSEAIALDKAQKAFDIVQQPLIVNDDSWIIPGLRGFPGPYMKDINQWFTAEDFLRLTLPLKDRRVFLRQYVVYKDHDETHLIKVDIEGTLLTEIRGESENPNDQIISFNEQGLSNAEARAQGVSVIAHKHTAWHELGAWLSSRANQ
jgi:non-canonical purine NTP pyrophosphatase (RdgB/HAM1 family)